MRSRLPTQAGQSPKAPLAPHCPFLPCRAVQPPTSRHAVRPALRRAVVVSGIPQPTTCPVTVGSPKLPTFVVAGFTGSPSSPKITDLYTLNSAETPAPG